MPPEIVLASTSRYRHELLARLGLAFRGVAPDCDEEAYKARGLAPEALAETLALAKAESVRAAHPHATIIGSDQVAAIDGQILGKPGTRENAARQLALLAGRTHRLITAVAVIQGERVLRHTDVAHLTVRSLSEAQIARYVAADDPLDCAGSYKLERRGIALLSRIQSDDYTAIVGLPLVALGGLLVTLGYEVP
jgi:septum formation protein